MSAFLYFLPGKPDFAPSPDAIVAAGLAYAFESRPHAAGVHNSPSGQKGSVLGCKQRWAEPGLVKYVPDPKVQEWRKIPGSEAWVGRYVGEAIRPDHLKRAMQLDGYLIELADGHKWQVPKAREYHRADACTREQFLVAYCHKVPQVMRQDDEGNWDELDTPLPRYQALWDLCLAWNEYQRGNPTDDDLQRWGNLNHYMQSATVALAANYAIGPTEASLLGLFTMQHATRVLDAVIDTPGFERIKKKWLAERETQISVASGSTSPAGPEADTPAATAPPSPT